jgi:hypothetical protein
LTGDRQSIAGRGPTKGVRAFTERTDTAMTKTMYATQVAEDPLPRRTLGRVVLAQSLPSAALRQSWVPRPVHEGSKPSRATLHRPAAVRGQRNTYIAGSSPP